jgi:hypothetical protein
MSELSPKEIAVIAEHERVPEIIAAELGSKLIQTPAGRVLLKNFINDNLANARARHLDDKARELRHLLRTFEREHRART